MQLHYIFYLIMIFEDFVTLTYLQQAFANMEHGQTDRLITALLEMTGFPVVKTNATKWELAWATVFTECAICIHRTILTALRNSKNSAAM